MTKATKDFSIHSLKWMLIIFLFLGTIASIYIALSTNKNSISINHIRAVNHFIQSDAQNSDQVISKSEYKQLLKFDSYMDSLHKTNVKLYDTIMKFRPGLLDSIKLLESFYHNQNK